MKKIGVTCSIAYGSNNRIFSLGIDYVNAIYHVGAIPVVIPANLPASLANEYAKTIDALLVPGGDDVSPCLYNQDPHPTVTLTTLDRDTMEISLIKKMAELNKPIMGICRGLQLINVSFGGNLIQDIPSQFNTNICHSQSSAIRREVTHKVTTVKGSLINEVLGDTLFTNSFHHQAINSVAKDFIVSAHANDGLPEAIEHCSKPIFAVQWHPENLYSTQPVFQNLFQKLSDLA